MPENHISFFWLASSCGGQLAKKNQIVANVKAVSDPNMGSKIYDLFNGNNPCLENLPFWNLFQLSRTDYHTVLLAQIALKIGTRCGN